MVSGVYEADSTAPLPDPEVLEEGTKGHCGWNSKIWGLVGSKPSKVSEVRQMGKPRWSRRNTWVRICASGRSSLLLCGERMYTSELWQRAFSFFKMID